jgi:hypothetical protein
VLRVAVAVSRFWLLIRARKSPKRSWWRSGDVSPSHLQPRDIKYKLTHSTITPHCAAYKWAWLKLRALRIQALQKNHDTPPHADQKRTWLQKKHVDQKYIKVYVMVAGGEGNDLKGAL